MQWLSKKEMDTVSRTQIYDKVACFLHSVNTSAKSMNHTILFSAMGK